MLEGAKGGADNCAIAAGLVFDKLFARLAPLVGSAGVKALLARSAKLTGRHLGILEVSDVESSAALRARLSVQDHSVAMELSAALFGLFFTLIVTYIGQRLTTQVLRSAWPTLNDDADPETRDK